MKTKTSRIAMLVLIIGLCFCAYLYMMVIASEPQSRIICAELRLSATVDTINSIAISLVEVIGDAGV